MFFIVIQDNKSYVCDVNGWSFVKRSKHYYDDCARIVRDMILTAVAPSIYSQQRQLPRTTTLRAKVCIDSELRWGDEILYPSG